MGQLIECPAGPQVVEWVTVDPSFGPDQHIHRLADQRHGRGGLCGEHRTRGSSIEVASRPVALHPAHGHLTSWGGGELRRDQQQAGHRGRHDQAPPVTPATDPPPLADPRTDGRDQERQPGHTHPGDSFGERAGRLAHPQASPGEAAVGPTAHDGLAQRPQPSDQKRYDHQLTPPAAQRPRRPPEGQRDRYRSHGEQQRLQAGQTEPRQRTQKPSRPTQVRHEEGTAVDQSDQKGSARLPAGEREQGQGDADEGDRPPAEFGECSVQPHASQSRGHNGPPQRQRRPRRLRGLADVVRRRTGRGDGHADR